MPMELSSHTHELGRERLGSKTSSFVLVTRSQNPKSDMGALELAISPPSEPILPQTSLRPMQAKIKDKRVSHHCIQMRLRELVFIAFQWAHFL